MQDDADPAKVDARNAKQIAMGNPPFILGLSQMAKRGMLPTPQASDYIDKNTSKSWESKGGINFSLGNPKIRGTLPTPNAMDWNSAKRPETYLASVLRHKEKGVTQQMTLRQMAMFIPNKVDHPKLGTASQLNPHFVAEMMGFPLNWTDLPFLSGEKKV